MTARTIRSIPQHYADQSFPHVLIVSTFGAIAVLAAVWLTAVAIA
jgi:hypothetical protein